MNQTERTEQATDPARPRWRFLLAAVAAVLGLLAGFSAAQIWPAPPGDTSPEAGFARDMSSHHAQAVEIAMLGHERAALPQLRTLSYDIALTQQAQIGIMGAWLDEWRLLPTGSRPKMAWMSDGSGAVGADGLMPGMASPAELADLRAASGQDFDVKFCQLMLRHHLGGIHMVDEVLKLSDDSRVTRMARAMKVGQQKEVAVLRDLLDRLGAKPL